MVPINYAAVIVAGVVNMVLGFIWYGPLFGKQWAEMMGFTAERMEKTKSADMNKSYAIMMAGSFIMAYILAHFFVFASTYTFTFGLSAGLMVGLWSWLGFIAPVTVGSVLWEGKPWKLWLINSGYYLVGLLLMGMVLGIFQTTM